jgi:hypothetical protein
MMNQSIKRTGIAVGAGLLGLMGCHDDMWVPTGSPRPRRDTAQLPDTIIVRHQPSEELPVLGESCVDPTRHDCTAEGIHVFCHLGTWKPGAGLLTAECRRGADGRYHLSTTHLGYIGIDRATRRAPVKRMLRRVVVWKPRFRGSGCDNPAGCRAALS